MDRIQTMKTMDRIQSINDGLNPYYENCESSSNRLYLDPMRIRKIGIKSNPIKLNHEKKKSIHFLIKKIQSKIKFRICVTFDP